MNFFPTFDQSCELDQIIDQLITIYFMILFVHPYLKSL